MAKSNPTNTPNVLNDVAIEEQARLDWYDILSTFATTIRCKDGYPNKLMAISEDSAYINAAGTLVVYAVVGQDKLELQVPPEMWKWKGSLETVQQNR